MDFVEFNIRERSGKLLSNPVQRVILEKYNYISEGTNLSCITVP